MNNIFLFYYREFVMFEYFYVIVIKYTNFWYFLFIITTIKYEYTYNVHKIIFCVYTIQAIYNNILHTYIMV